MDIGLFADNSVIIDPVHISSHTLASVWPDFPERLFACRKVVGAPGFDTQPRHSAWEVCQLSLPPATCQSAFPPQPRPPASASSVMGEGGSPLVESAFCFLWP